MHAAARPAPALVPHEGERIEREALASLHAAADAATSARLGLASENISGAWLSLAPALPPSAIVVNRALGVGGGAGRAAAVAGIAARYRAAGIARFFLNADPDAGPDLDAACTASGLVPARAWQKFVRERFAPLPETAPMEIAPVDPDTAPAIARIVCAAFDLGEAAEPWLARLATAPGWQVFVALIDGEPAGTGALFVRDGIGWTDWGATAPPFRGRGVQRALLAHRVARADRMGLARLHTCTGVAVPGEPQHSYANILRCGFVETYQRANYAPPR